VAEGLVVRGVGLESAAKMASVTPSSLRRRNHSLKTQLYFGYAYRPHQSVMKMKLFENALQTGRISVPVLRFSVDGKDF